MTAGHVPMSLDMRTATAVRPTVQPEQTLLLTILRICQEVSAISPSQTKTAPCVMKCASLASASHQPLKTQLSVIQRVARTAAEIPDFSTKTSPKQMMDVFVYLMKTVPCVMKCVDPVSASPRSPMTRLSVIQMVARIAADPPAFKPRASIKKPTTTPQQTLAATVMGPTNFPIIIVKHVSPIQENLAAMRRSILRKATMTSILWPHGLMIIPPQKKHCAEC